MVWFQKLTRRYEVYIVLKLFLSEKEELDYHFGRIQFEDRGCTQATISVLNTLNMRLLIEISKQTLVAFTLHSLSTIATIKRCDLSATILIKLINSYLIALKFAQ